MQISCIYVQQNIMTEYYRKLITTYASIASPYNANLTEI